MNDNDWRRFEEDSHRLADALIIFTRVMTVLLVILAVVLAIAVFTQQIRFTP